MKRLGRWVLLLAAAALTVSVISCISKDEEKKKHKHPLTWAGLAELINEQLGVVSDANPAVTCSANVGIHCKDQLNGTANTGLVQEYLEISNDTVLFGNTAFWQRGFTLNNNLCEADMDVNGFADYAEFSAANCVPQGGSLQCIDYGDNQYTLIYDSCQWTDAGVTWGLDGAIDIYAYVTEDDEQLTFQNFSGFTGTDLSSGGTAYYTVNGTVVNYTVLDPFTGMPALGTDGVSDDSMVIVQTVATVDTDGANGASPATTYGSFFALDSEDGLVLLSSVKGAVWPTVNDPDTVPVPPGDRIRFYDKTFPWDNNAAGCIADVTNIDTVARTFTLTSPNACMADVPVANY